MKLLQILIDTATFNVIGKTRVLFDFTQTGVVDFTVQNVTEDVTEDEFATIVADTINNYDTPYVNILAGSFGRYVSVVFAMPSGVSLTTHFVTAGTAAEVYGALVERLEIHSTKYRSKLVLDKMVVASNRLILSRPKMIFIDM